MRSAAATRSGLPLLNVCLGSRYGRALGRLAMLLLPALPGRAQVRLALTARVDTAQPAVRQVFRLLGSYFNSRPDSLYANPYWNAAEVATYVGEHHERVDLAAPFLFNGMSARETLATFAPTVLSIEPAGPRYVARVLLATTGTSPAWVQQTSWNPPFILRYYAAPDAAGTWQLANAWGVETARWPAFATPWVRFHYPPGFAFDPARARQASAFCDSVVTALHLTQAQPFDYYVMDSEEQLGRLFNLEYWLAYNTGFTQKAHNRTLSARGREQHRHEFVHMLYPLLPNYFLAEGVATYLGGVDGYTPYRQTLREVATDLARHHPQVTYRDLYDSKFHYPTNANPRYVAAALAYELVARRAGVAGFRQLEQSENTYESFLQHFAAVLRLSPARADALLNQQLRAAGR